MQMVAHDGISVDADGEDVAKREDALLDGRFAVLEGFAADGLAPGELTNPEFRSGHSSGRSGGC